MARTCNDCSYSSPDPFVDRCPECGGFLAITSRSTHGPARRPRPDDDPRTARTPAHDRRPTRDPDRSPADWRQWAIPVAVAGIVVGGVIWWDQQKVRPPNIPGPVRIAADGPRIGIGTSVRDAVLALEPEPPAGRTVTLHDLLGPNAPQSGQFRWSDGRRTVAATFRNGIITSVNESTFQFPGGFDMEMPTEVSISAADPTPPPTPQE